jgi:hypothetical protein
MIYNYLHDVLFGLRVALEIDLSCIMHGNNFEISKLLSKEPIKTLEGFKLFGATPIVLGAVRR